MESLKAKALRQFDALVERGNVLWEENSPRLVTAKPFNFQFRIAPSWKTKPILQPNDPGRTQDRGAFADDDPDFFLEHVGPSHTLILNKFCVVRPQYVLHTTAFEPQYDKLSVADFKAAWSVLSRLESEHIVIFNCGVDAGASQGHKHLQIVPAREEFNLFPDVLGIDHESCTVPGIPFRHAVQRLPSPTSTADVVEMYKQLIEIAGVKETPAHNVILTPDWLLVIPRSHARDGKLAASAASMVGMVWVTEESEFQEWLDQGPMEVLCRFGVTKETS
ncbi:hypothetical protein HYALB_00009471 [Hymenoscyphus albidus]|uniref:Ap4A phosphorylase II n=1 Tax=Hymenoscyphus albidus TaxID=595503 RepID=A0A9N9M044_9HELO|nr:hypothetical protein HYALB_00009471 [Hymenoscyphus albidus]